MNLFLICFEALRLAIGKLGRKLKILSVSSQQSQNIIFYNVEVLDSLCNNDTNLYLLDIYISRNILYYYYFFMYSVCYRFEPIDNLSL